jgi:hypothetical protein
VRKYDATPLTDTELAAIQQVLNGVKQLPGQSANFEIANAGKLKSVAAPHAILAYSPDNDAALANIGYALQTVDLWLQGNGYGSIWMGMGKPIAPKPDYRILLAFGKTEIPLRSGESGYKRKPVSEISNEDNAIARAARIAPSAANLQPWQLNFSQCRVCIQYNGKGIGKLFAGKMQKIDLGIILKHVELALEQESRKIIAITPKIGAKIFEMELAYE